ncbi:MAG: hypothetical protein WBW33_15980 [Bryobacteraceae bacterium]
MGFFWEKGGVITDLGTLPGDYSSNAFGINELGQVVGESCDINSNCRAYLLQNGVMTDLNTLPPSGSPLYLLTAFDINSSGQIDGLALEISTGEVHAFLATPQNGQGGSESAGLAVQSAVVSQSQKVVLPDNVRQLLSNQLGPGLIRARYLKQP